MSLREQMPLTAQLVDQLRLQHGKEFVGSQMRKAIKGEMRCFWARENGIEVGTRNTSITSSYVLNERGISVRVDPDWMIDALELAKRKGIVIERVDFACPDEARVVAKQLRLIIEEDKND